MKHFLSLGAGVQSSTMALMAACGEITPMPEAAIFADTQAEPPSVYEWLDWLEKQLPFPVHRVTAGNLAADVILPRITADGRRYCRTNIPFFMLDNNTGERGIITMRSCTKDFKIRPITKKIRDLVGRDVIARWWRDRKNNRSSEPLATQWIGISLDEMKRMKTSRDPWSQHRWPLIEMRRTRVHCLEWMQLRGYPKPPRSACIFCPFHSNAEWRRLQLEEPEQFEKAVQLEKSVQATGRFKSIPYLHRSCTPLDRVDFRSDVEKGQLTLWDDECEGMCGV